MSQLVRWSWYSRQDAWGNEVANVRWLRLGSRRWYVKAGKWGIIARLGSLHLSLHFDQSDDDA